MTQDSLTGRIIGGYQLIRRLGRGGMASVYLAHDKKLQREVAVKVLHGVDASDPSFQARFEQEALATARLDHPNIVHIYDYGHESDLTFMAMEYCPNGTLLDQMSRASEQGKPIEPDYIIAIASQIAVALDFAHQHGIIHRDIKPSNILFAKDGRPVLADLGISKALTSPKLTRTQTMIGTPEYMSPEQGRGEAVDYRTDLYSLGVVLYEMLAGRPPYRADTPWGVIYKHMTETPPPIRQQNPRVSVALASVLEQAMAKNPAERFQSGREMAEALQVAQQRPNQPVVMPPGHRAAPPAWPVSADSPAMLGSPATPYPLPAATPPPRARSSPSRWLLPLVAVLAALAIVFSVFTVPRILPRQTDPTVFDTVAEPSEAATFVAVVSEPTKTATPADTPTVTEASMIVGQTLAGQAELTSVASAAITEEAQQATTQTAEAIRLTETHSAEVAQAKAAVATATHQANETAWAKATVAAKAKQVPMIVAKSEVNLRAGTDTSFPKVGSLSGSQELRIIGRNEDSSWWQVEQPGGKSAWVNGQLVSVRGNLDTVSVAPTPTRPPAPTALPTPSQPGVVVDFERDLNVERGNQAYGTFDDRARDQIHGGAYAGRLRYDFPAVVDNYVVFMPKPPVPIGGQPTGLVAWVYGDGSGHYLNAWVLDAAGEVRAYTFGKVQHVGWQAMTAWLAETGWPNGNISPPDNGQLDYPVKLYAIVLDGVPDGQASLGEVVIDDITVTQGTQPIAATPAPAPTPGPTATGSALLPDSPEPAGMANVGGLLGLGGLIGILLVADDPRPWRRVRRRR